MARDLHQSGGARDRDEDAPEPPQLRRFRRLVSLSLVVMMVGMLGIMGALVWKITQADQSATPPPIAAEIEVPEGFKVISVSRAGARFYLLLEDDQSGERQIQERRVGDMSLRAQYRLVKMPDT